MQHSSATKGILNVTILIFDVFSATFSAPVLTVQGVNTADQQLISDYYNPKGFSLYTRSNIFNLVFHQRFLFFSYLLSAKCDLIINFWRD